MIFNNKQDELRYKLTPFKYFENTVGAIIVKSETEENEIKEELKEYTSEIDDNEIKLVNGSIITIIKPKSGSEPIRGKRAEIPMVYDDFYIDRDMVNEVLDEFINDKEVK